jgi:hypothetical protein
VDRKDENRNQIIQQNRIVENQPPKKQKKQHQFSEPLLQILNWFLKRPFVALSSLLLLGSLVFCLLVAPAIGMAAGAAMGSFRGVTQGIAAGTEAGKEAGLSAEDTTVKIGNKMTETGNLQVMLVDLKLSDIYQQGPENNPQYAALLEIEGEGVFSVNLTQSKITYNEIEKQITITIPDPVFTPYFDDNMVKTLAEYRPRIFDGSTINGYQGYLNSRTQINERVQEEMLSMLEPAKESALKQVELIARSVCGSEASIQVSFIEGEI